MYSCLRRAAAKSGFVDFTTDDVFVFACVPAGGAFCPKNDVGPIEVDGVVVVDIAEGKVDRPSPDKPGSSPDDCWFVSELNTDVGCCCCCWPAVAVDDEPKADCMGADDGAPKAEVVVMPLPKTDDDCWLLPPPNADGVLLVLPVVLLAAPPKAGWPNTEPPGALAAAASPNAEGWPPAKAENAPPLEFAVLLVPEEDGLAKAENAPPLEPADPAPKAEVAAGFPNALCPNADCPKADVVCGAPNADGAAPDAGCPNADAVLP